MVDKNSCIYILLHMNDLLAKDSSTNKLCPLEVGTRLIDKVPDSLINLPLGFEHPNPGWKNQDGELSVGKLQLDQSIRFRGIIRNDILDGTICAIFEKIRTDCYIMSLFRNDVQLDQLFAGDFEFLSEFDGFPNKPYLSYLPKDRLKFLSKFQSQFTEDSINDFFSASPGYDFFKLCGCEFHKVPLELYIDPSMGKEELCKQVRKQYDKISKHAESKLTELIKRGFPYSSLKKSKRINSRIFEMLKVLGHYRLSTCVHLGWKKITKSFGGNSYKEERTYREGLKKYFEEYFHKVK